MTIRRFGLHLDFAKETRHLTNCCLCLLRRDLVLGAKLLGRSSAFQSPDSVHDTNRPRYPIVSAEPRNLLTSRIRRMSSEYCCLLILVKNHCERLL
jgi:hypothetical protein